MREVRKWTWRGGVVVLSLIFIKSVLLFHIIRYARTGVPHGSKRPTIRQFFVEQVPPASPRTAPSILSSETASALSLIPLGKLEWLAVIPESSELSSPLCSQQMERPKSRWRLRDTEINSGSVVPKVRHLLAPFILFIGPFVHAIEKSPGMPQKLELLSLQKKISVLSASFVNVSIRDNESSTSRAESALLAVQLTCWLSRWDRF